MLTSTQYTPLRKSECRLLAEMLEETPKTAAVIHALLNGRSTVFLLGDLSEWQVAVMELADLPGEPVVFAADAASAWSLVKHLDGWDCVLTETPLARPLGELMQTDGGLRVRYYGDLGYELREPAQCFTHPAVRVLGPADFDRLDSLPKELGSIERSHGLALLQAGLIAGAIVADGLVSIALVDAPMGRYNEIGVATLAPWRGRGYATAAASQVARNIQRAGRIPVWSTGEDNHASLHIAHKLGFVECFRRTYVIRV